GRHARLRGVPQAGGKKLVHPFRRILTRMSTLTAPEARRQLDAHVREIIDWHFNPQTGSPFWVDAAAGKNPLLKLGFDPRKEIRSFDDLKKFGLFEDEWLRGGPVRRWQPKALWNKPTYVFETGGT